MVNTKVNAQGKKVRIIRVKKSKRTNVSELDNLDCSSVEDAQVVDRRATNHTQVASLNNSIRVPRHNQSDLKNVDKKRGYVEPQATSFVETYEPVQHQNRHVPQRPHLTSNKLSPDKK